MRQAVSVLVLITVFQVFMGFGSWMFTLPEVSAAAPLVLAAGTRSGHVVTGSMVLATSVVVTLRAYRLLTRNVSRAGTVSSATEELDR